MTKGAVKSSYWRTGYSLFCKRVLSAWLYKGGGFLSTIAISQIACGAHQILV